MRGTAETITVTPRLFLGPPENASVWPDLIPMENASDAFTVIRSGHSALLPPGAWDMAAEVLRKLGADEELVKLRLAQAGHTGHVNADIGERETA